jgi:hypothetical protein
MTMLSRRLLLRSAAAARGTILPLNNAYARGVPFVLIAALTMHRDAGSGAPTAARSWTSSGFSR